MLDMLDDKSESAFDSLKFTDIIKIKKKITFDEFQNLIEIPVLKSKDSASEKKIRN